MSADHSVNGPRNPAPEPSEDGTGGRRIPPPAFPPGSRRIPARAKPAGKEASSAFIAPDDPIPVRTGQFPQDAFISPDDPILRKEPDPIASGLISPDDPIPPRSDLNLEESEADEDFDPESAVVTGIGNDPHLDPAELALGFDPHVLEIVDKVNKLAEALKRKGEAGLRSTPEMGRFEATLRAYCVGYLAGRRAEEEDAGGPPEAV